MKIKDLIEELQKHDPEMEILKEDSGDIFSLFPNIKTEVCSVVDFYYADVHKTLYEENADYLNEKEYFHNPKPKHNTRKAFVISKDQRP